MIPKRKHELVSEAAEPAPGRAPDETASGLEPDLETRPESWPPSEIETAGMSHDADIDWGQAVHLDEHGNPRMVERRFVVEESSAGYRVDHYLKRKIPRLSRTKIQAIVRTQLLPVRGRRLKPHASVMPGDEIVIRRPARAEPPCPRTFGVLYRDPHMMVIDKPAGLPVHASAKFYFNTLTRVMAERFPGENLQICHRLDRETSGALVVARGKESAARLKGAFAAHTVQKTYLAVVYGQPPWPGGMPGDAADGIHAGISGGIGPGGLLPAEDDYIIDLPLGLVDDPGARIDVRMEVRPGALPARTQVRVLERHGDYALVRCIPITGRQHQIRAHLAATGHPIVGDKLYAHGDELFARACDQGLSPELLAILRLPRQALHAAAITVPHPVTREPVRVESPLPADLRRFLSDPEAATAAAVAAASAGLPGYSGGGTEPDMPEIDPDAGDVD